MNMIKKVGSKLDEKIKTGEIKENELMQEASVNEKNDKHTRNEKYGKNVQ